MDVKLKRMPQLLGIVWVTETGRMAPKFDWTNYENHIVLRYPQTVLCPLIGSFFIILSIPNTSFSLFHLYKALKKQTLSPKIQNSLNYKNIKYMQVFFCLPVLRNSFADVYFNTFHRGQTSCAEDQSRVKAVDLFDFIRWQEGAWRVEASLMRKNSTDFRFGFHI